jgi:hypothetical protein
MQRFERRLENLVQGAFARTFGGWVEPVEVAAALTREAEDKKAILAAGRVLVPNTYTVELSPADAERLGEYDEALRKELATMVGESATEHGWSFVGPVEVLFEVVDALDTGAFRVRSTVQAGVVDAPAAPTGGPALFDGTREIPLTGTLVLGRGTDVDLQLHDTGVSRRHAEVRVVDDHVEVHDLGSTNGLTVNGRRVSAATLTDGDVLVVGSSQLTFRAGR